jgi:hypothetical protein
MDWSFNYGPSSISTAVAYQRDVPW